MTTQSLFTTGKLITPVTPIISILGFAHLGIAVSDKRLSLEFYSKIGFSPKNDFSAPIVQLENKGGFQVHLFDCDKPIEDNKNILMDFPSNKFPGHTHAAFCVPNMLAAKEFFDNAGLITSGERKIGEHVVAYFLRDPDRTTLEFEMAGADKISSADTGIINEVKITADDIGNPRGLDHVGVRVSNPEVSLQWYAEKLGFVNEVNIYERDQEILKNFRPWISRASSGIDSQLIINANETPDYNILTSGGVIRPGIIYLTYIVADVDDAAAKLAAAGVEAVEDANLDSTDFGIRPCHIITPKDGKSRFFRDPDFNILRIVQI